MWRYNNPAKKGYNKTLQAFPKYIEEGERERTGKADPCPPETWIPNFNGTSPNYNEVLAKPCPPPSQMVLNQRKLDRLQPHHVRQTTGPVGSLVHQAVRASSQPIARVQAQLGDFRR